MGVVDNQLLIGVFMMGVGNLFLEWHSNHDVQPLQKQNINKDMECNKQHIKTYNIITMYLNITKYDNYEMNPNYIIASLFSF